MRRPGPVSLALATLVLFGIGSVLIGQDANWDLRNYHRYDPWALLDGRLGLDLAPAGMPTYFNPLLDLPYHALSLVLPPPALAFAMGAWHGLTALMLYAIGRATMTDPADRWKAVVFAAVGCAGAAFLAELGNTMGDDTTAPLLLGALALVLSADASVSTRRMIVAGFVAGCAIGLKLTNAPYGLALVAATLVHGRSSLRRASLVATGLAVGVALTFGWWAVTMTAHFGNPFFPQFNALFNAPLAADTGIVDDKWFPSDATEAALFPFAFTLFPLRIHEIPLANPLWPLVYTLLIVAMIAALLRARRTNAIESKTRALVVFAVVAYVAWLFVFSIGRYLIVLETLFPLLAWLLLHRLFHARLAATIAWAAMAIAVAMPVVRFETWGNAPFADDRAAYRVEVPTIADPGRATVLVLASPVAWVLPDFPREVAYVGRNGSFPESSAYRAHVRALVDRRGGPVYALLPVDAGEEASGLARMNAFFATRSTRDEDLPCRYARAVLAHAPAKDIVFDETANGACRFRREPSRNRLSDRDAATIARAIEPDGMRVDLSTCTTFRAWIGAAPFAYRLCPVAVER